MTTAVLDREIAGQCYADVYELITETVRRFVRKHGGNYDDLLADASTAFMLGHRAFLEGRANTPHYEVEIKRWVWYELFDAYRVRTQHRRQSKTVIKNEEFPELLTQRRGDFSLVEFFDELSEDARVAARLVLDTPAELCAAARARGGTDRNLRCLLRQHLHAAGWTAARVSEAFEEIGRALS
jgi:hypothetical protein